MKFILTFLVLSLLSFTTINAQNYDKLWQKVETLELKGELKSASRIVAKIYKKAKQKEHHQDVIKSFIYKSKFNQILKENNHAIYIKDLEREISFQSFPVNALLENIYANFLIQVYQKNRYRINKRSQTSIENKDIETWTSIDFENEIHKHLQNALKEKEKLQKEKLKNYLQILEGHTNSLKYRGTLYDYLVHEAISFYSWYPKNKVDLFALFGIETLLEDPEIFTQTNFQTDLKTSNINALKLYQELEAFHLKNKNYYELFDATKSRFNSVKNPNYNYTYKGIDIELFANSLNKIINKYKNVEASSLLQFYLAECYYDISKRYNLKSNPERKEYRKKAYHICETIIKQFPNTEAMLKAKLLLKTLDSKLLSLEIETINIPNQPTLGKITYTNIDSLYLSIYKIPFNRYNNINHYKRDSVTLAITKNVKPIKQKVYKLISENDFYSHSSEILIPKLDFGYYLFVLSHNKTLTKKNDFAYRTTTRTNLYATKTDHTYKNTFEIANRLTGEPIEDAEINLFSKNNSFKIKKNTNKKGIASQDKIEKYIENLSGFVTYKKDTLILNDIRIGSINRHRNDTEWNVYSKIILDRKIYRPGQTINFKAYLIQDKKGNRTVVKNTYCSIIISDANYNELKEFRLKTNEFGTVSASYKLPENILTGEFSIEIDEDYDYEEDVHPFWDEIDDFDYTEVEFFVEEYKRPRFEVAFNPTTENYILGDSIFIKGKAKSFFNSTISHAKVKYLVRVNGSIETNGETKTDNKGAFTIPFFSKNVSDLKKETKQQKTYTIEVSITDTNGETRTDEKEITIGNYNFNLKMELPYKVTPTSNNVIKLKSKNLNQGYVESKGKLRIYRNENKLQKLFKREWNLAEHQTISREEFKKFFPNLIFNLEEQNKEGKRELVFESDFEIKDELAINLETKPWKNGDYTIDIVAYDKRNDTITIGRNFSYFNKDLGGKQLESIFEGKVLNHDIKKDGFVKLKLFSALKNTFIKLNGYSKNKNIYTQIIKVNKDTIIKIPIRKGLTGQLNFSFYSNKLNNFEQNEFNLILTEQNNVFDIETLSFRNKIQPDVTETWSFKIKNLDKNVEVLASMYDESLDDFFKNNKNIYEEDYKLDWELSPENYQHSYPPYTKILNTGNYNISKNYSSSFYYNTIKRDYLKLNYFGLSFINNYTNKKYLESLKNRIYTKLQPIGNVSGVVYTTIDGLPLPGVNVIVKGTSRGVQTDFDGFYSIHANEGETLVFSYLGMVTYETFYVTSNSINIMLDEDIESLQEVVVEAYRTSTKKISNIASIMLTLQGQVAGLNITTENGQPGGNSTINLRGVSSLSANPEPLFIIDGVPVDEKTFAKLDATLIASLSVLKDASATAIYGNRGKNGVILITTKYGTKTELQEGKDVLVSITKEEITKIETRKNLKETSFFFPHLTTDSNNEVAVTFNTPQALTRWKFQLLAHNKNSQSGYLKLNTITQKELIVTPNFPRFFREGDTIFLSSKISNLSSKKITGNAYLQLYDAITNKELQVNNGQSFLLNGSETKSVSWSIYIPKNTTNIRYKIVASASNFSDGEEGVLEVLKKKILVTETLPLMTNATSKKEFLLRKLSKNTSSTLNHHQLTVEYTSNPVWFAFQSLPYLMTFPYDCAEQTFSKYYANALGNHIVNSNPDIKKYIDNIKLEVNSKKQKAINFEQNPWTEKTKRDNNIALLFDENKLQEQELNTIIKLKEFQLSNGAFAWFSSQGSANEFITRHIVASYGHLTKLGVKSENQGKLDKIIKKAISYLDTQYYKLIIRQKNAGGFKFSNDIVHHLYARSFYLEQYPIQKKDQELLNLYLTELEKNWVSQPLYKKGMIALIFKRFHKVKEAKQILKSLNQTCIIDDELGMYWKENELGSRWHQAPIETQALLIEAFSEIENNKSVVDNLKKWLLSNKQTNSWKTTKATTEAIYALMLKGSNWLTINQKTSIKIGDDIYKNDNKVQSGLGYYNIVLSKNEIDNTKANIKIDNKSKSPGFGGIYWQYFEDLDKITSAETPLKLKKKLFLKTNTEKGEEISEITTETSLQVGDLVRVRIELRVDRTMEFVHMKDMRAAGLEPVNVLSGYKWQDGLGYYESTKDASTNFFFDVLPKGVYVFEYDLRVNNAGNMSNGITTIQSMYAPEFSSHSEGVRISVENNQ